MVSNENNIFNLNNTKLYKKNEIKNFPNHEINKLDWFVFFIFVAFCFLNFVHSDILLTGGSSISYLWGDIKDPYYYNIVNEVEPSITSNHYFPSTYLLFAIWNIPIYLLNIVKCPMKDAVSTTPFFATMWYKALPVLFFLGCGYLIFKISKLIGFTKNKAKIIAFLFLTTPLAFFSSLIFGQYDSFTLFFVLLGVYYYFKNNMLKFTVFFGIAMTFKYFALLIYVPLLFLKEKKILKIIKHCLIFSVPILIEILGYIHSPDFKLGVFGFNAKNYLKKCVLDTGYTKLSIFVISWIFVVVCAYLKNVEVKEKEEFFKWAIYFSNVVVCLTFGLSFWHPQWLIFMVPFTLFSAVINKNARLFYIIDILLFLFFCLLGVTFFETHIDEWLMYFGLSNKFLDFKTEIIYGLKDVFFFLKDKNSYNLFFTLFSALLLVGAVFKHPKFTITRFNENFKRENGLFRLRFLSLVLFFVGPCVLCVLMSLASGEKYYFRNSNGYFYDVHNEPLNGDSVIEQHFKAPKNMTNLNELRVVFLKNLSIERPINHELEISIEDICNNEVLFSEKYDTCDFKNEFPTKFKLGDVEIIPENEYVITFKLNEGNSNPTGIMFKTTKKGPNPGLDGKKSSLVGDFKNQWYCIKGFSPKDNNLAYDLIGKKER